MWLQNLKCLKIKNRYTGHFPKLVFGHFYLVTRFSIAKQHIDKISLSLRLDEDKKLTFKSLT